MPYKDRNTRYHTDPDYRDVVKQRSRDRMARIKADPLRYREYLDKKAAWKRRKTAERRAAKIEKLIEEAATAVPTPKEPPRKPRKQRKKMTAEERRQRLHAYYLRRKADPEKAAIDAASRKRYREAHANDKLWRMHVSELNRRRRARKLMQQYQQQNNIQ